MPGRNPTSAKLIDNSVSHFNEDDVEGRLEAEPIYESQIFAMPEELHREDEKKKWEELVYWIKSIGNSPQADIDKDEMVRYCKHQCMFIRLDKRLDDEPDNKELRKEVKDNSNAAAKAFDKLGLGVVSRARIGKARNDHRKNKLDPINEIKNRDGK